MREIGIGILASAFFAVTFVLNRSMELAGGSWMWSASLRYFWMIPFLLLLVLLRRNLKGLWLEMRKYPLQWLLWSFVGFVLFYGPITFAASFGPGWLVAGTWQLTIVCGALLTPLFKPNVKARFGLPFSTLAVSFFILAGVVMIQLPNASSLSTSEMLLGVSPVVIAAFAFPLGNRKMMELCEGRIDTLQRVLGMTLASLPFWIVLSGVALWQVGVPAPSQIVQSGIVGICSGVIATTLLFYATNQVRTHQAQLASVEATQSMQVVFVILGEMLLLSIAPPTGIAIIGVLIIMVGMLLHSYLSYKHNRIKHLKEKAS
ncbi:DMT family transporter [Alkalicoccobacillus porphyridii]|uniref:Multidrug resistance efflux transporter family protein n=1 Tax=Alkalicoccobacillus porphyridii TaxID=2597270 RepID=A0A553ZZI1_9BACI|nr:multidrug resistance efflux transporter family protein [Alkalicoccobacillus porphyridii]TSB46849.1 multidrug resistance efflux transporter family protein [Alkalicoccobacillus porphyridii]